MEESYRSSSPESCTNELTRSNSGASSLSVANSKDTLLHSGYATTDKYTGWTNEKHNTFLDCLEASFVKQLHRSMALRAGSVELNKSCSNLSEKLSAHFNKSSEQLPFLHDGCWKKIKTVRKPPVVYVAADSHDSLNYLGSDGHHHFLDCQFCCELHCKGKRTRDKRSSSCGHVTRSHLILSKPAELQKTVCRITEGSGQNFVNEDFDENSRCKKMKTTSVETTDQEQIVPTRNMGVQELLVPCSRVMTK
ncbi:hypothetical protein K7X08_036907 [Anisodus acutangulus]|uniref:Uncharacterized protein n=1 Tax=Anisodus acutangulus TaxID=402998 RepID=A0A9Q1L6U5_9SOLA|nr:hypothetical protein K7X08_036907 [Anisodus acutangulus]